MINGPEAFTPDNEFCLGETEVAGFFVAAGFCAHGIAGAGGIGKVMAELGARRRPGAGPVAHGRAPLRPPRTGRRRTRSRASVENYETYYDIRYPGAERPAGRPLRTLARLRLARRARRVLRREGGLGAGELLRAQRAAADEALRPARLGRAALVAVRRARAPGRARGAALFDESSFAKIEISGPDAAAFLRTGVRQRTSPRPLGRRHLHAGAERARRHRDGRDRDPAGAPTRSSSSPARRSGRTTWPGCAARPGCRTPTCGSPTSPAPGRASGCGVRGARDVLAPLTPADLSNAAFPYPDHAGDDGRRRAGARAAGDLRRRARLGAVLPGGVRRRRCGGRWSTPGSRTGCARPATGRSSACAWRRATGCGVRTSPRDTTPDEAGLAFAVRPGGGFAGAEALAATRARGPAGDRPAPALPGARRPAGGRPGRRAGGGRRRGRPSGHVTSGGYGYTVGRSIAYAYCPRRGWARPAVRSTATGSRPRWSAGPLYDPKGDRIRA